MEHPPGGTNLVVLVEDEADDVARLLVGVHLDPIGKELDVAQPHVMEELIAVRLRKRLPEMGEQDARR